MQALDQASPLGVVRSDGDVLRADCGTEGVPDGATELRASIRGDGCGYAKPGDPGGDESTSTVISCCIGQGHSFHPPGSAIYDSKKIFITTCSGKRCNQIHVDMAELAGGDGDV